eukprot:2624934-Prymnesium_polylepis.1
MSLAVSQLPVTLQLSWAARTMLVLAKALATTRPGLRWWQARAGSSSGQPAVPLAARLRTVAAAAPHPPVAPPWGHAAPPLLLAASPAHAVRLCCCCHHSRCCRAQRSRAEHTCRLSKRQARSMRMRPLVRDRPCTCALCRTHAVRCASLAAALPAHPRPHPPKRRPPTSGQLHQLQQARCKRQGR